MSSSSSTFFSSFFGASFPAGAYYATSAALGASY
jgi:hypothetical protein